MRNQASSSIKQGSNEWIVFGGGMINSSFLVGSEIVWRSTLRRKLAQAMLSMLAQSSDAHRVRHPINQTESCQNGGFLQACPQAIVVPGKAGKTLARQPKVDRPKALSPASSSDEWKGSPANAQKHKCGRAALAASKAGREGAGLTAQLLVGRREGREVQAKPPGKRERAVGGVQGRVAAVGLLAARRRRLGAFVLLVRVAENVCEDSTARGRRQGGVTRGVHSPPPLCRNYL